MYKIVKCLNCKNYAITTGDVSFKCLNCNKTFDITKMRIYYSTDSGQIATKVLQKIKEEQARNKFGDDRYDTFM